MDEQLNEVSSQAASAASDSADTVLQSAQNVDLSGVSTSLSAIGQKMDDLVSLLQGQHESVNTLLSGLATLQMFTLLSQLILLGVVLVVVFVVTLRRF